MKKTKRKAFNFYRSYYDAWNLCETNDEKVEFMDAVLNKQFLSEEPDYDEMSRVVRLIYMGQKHSIDKQVNGYWFKVDAAKKDPIEDPTEGGSQDPTEDPIGDPSGSIVMTTEDPTEGSYQQEEVKVKEEEKEEVQVEVQVQEWNSTNQLNKLMTIFGENPVFFNANKEIWNGMVDYEKQKAVEMAPEYIKWDKRDNKSLRFYLIDRKWEWDLTISTKSDNNTEIDWSKTIN